MLHEMAMSDCAYGCKIYANENETVQVVSHNSSYGCQLGAQATKRKTPEEIELFRSANVSYEISRLMLSGWADTMRLGDQQDTEEWMWQMYTAARQDFYNDMVEAFNNLAAYYVNLERTNA